MDSEKIKIITPTPNGYCLAQLLQEGLNKTEIWTKENSNNSVNNYIHTYPEKLSEILPKLWSQSSQLIFILTVGAVVRLIAPLLQDKKNDPGVVVVDETGKFVISLSGGHQGGADTLARQIATLLGVEPIITSASEGIKLPAVDLLGQPYGWNLGEGDWLAVAASITQMQPVGVIQTCGWDLWQNSLPKGHPFTLIAQEQLQNNQLINASLQAYIWISDQLPPKINMPLVCWYPRTLWVGIGCERGTAADLLEQSLREVLQYQRLAWSAIAGLTSLDLKQDEQGLLELADKFHFPLKFFSAEELAPISVPNPSAIVQREVGTSSVAEAAAIKAAQSPLIVPKQIYSPNNSQGACTIAIARSTIEYNPRIGKLYLIGTGPGSTAQITPAAQRALKQCDVVIGYQLYIDIIESLLHPQQIVERSQITQEVQRAERAITLAQRGLTVGVVSSGDCGIYGMAGLVLECLTHLDWDGKEPQVEVFPGITALQAVAARLGSPLMHDFCAISLSNLLTPWSVIEKRLAAAAQADFVVALYNPRSRTRTEGIKTAVEIFRQYRSPQTPIAIARSVYRSDESIYLTNLDEVDITMIDMLTVVLIGNQSTFKYQNHLITPRGYLNR